MKIALFTDGIHPHVIGGIQRHSYYLCKFLSQNGVQVDLYHYLDDERNAEDELACFNAVERKNINSILIKFPKHKRLPGHYVRESYEYSELVYAEFCKRKKVDFVYSKNYTSWKYLEEKIKGIELPPIGVKLHGYEAFQIHTNLRDYTYTYFHKPATIFNTHNADLVFSYGGKITDLIVEKTDTPLSKVIEIPSGINPEWTKSISEVENSISEPINLVFLGRFTKRKGIHFINKWIKKSTNNFNVSFIGPIPEENRINDKRVRYYGLIRDSERLKSILLEQDVLLCPSLAEGMPNVILEGMAMGCAIIATDVGATSIMVNKKNGWLIEPNSFKAFETSMNELFLSSKVDIIEKKSNSRTKAIENFNWEMIAKSTISHISNYLKTKNE